MKSRGSNQKDRHTIYTSNVKNLQIWELSNSCSYGINSFKIPQLDSLNIVRSSRSGSTNIFRNILCHIVHAFQTSSMDTLLFCSLCLNTLNIIATHCNRIRTNSFTMF